MRPGKPLACILAGCLVVCAPLLAGQAQGPANKKQNQPAQPPPNSPNSQPSAPSQPNSNPFPEDESTVPVLPSANTPDLPADGNGTPIGAAAPVDRDPVRSPEDMAPSDNGQTQGFSSSQSGLDNLTPPPDDEPAGKKRKGESIADTMPRENPQQDVNVGNYYMDRKDWKGALSRFQSALVLDPENPEVYWGLAECQHHLGQFAQARANYLKVMEYDPDSKHAKEAKKALKEPDMANAKPAGQH